MAFNLPPVEHVVYQDQRLERVICQLRFNPLLRIAAEAPADFQDRLRDVYPHAQPSSTASLSMMIQGGSVSAQAGQSLSGTWRFSSSDENWTVTLAQDFVALHVSKYPHFGEFADRVESVLATLSDTYRIPTFNRVGLRYSNAFEPELGAPDKLLSEQLWGLYATPLRSRIQSSRVEYLLGDDAHMIGLRIGMVPQPDNGAKLLLDFDHYTEGDMPMEEVMPLLRTFHDVNYRMFRWAISDELHNVMRPNDGK